MAKGSCNCGAVTFETTGPLRDVVYCHCTQCRKQTGHFVAATSSSNADITIIGEDNITWYAASPDAQRGFCRTCGSALFWRPKKEASRTSIWAGSFDAPSGLKASHHIYVADKGEYYEICDGLPQFDGAD